MSKAWMPVLAVASAGLVAAGCGGMSTATTQTQHTGKPVAVVLDEYHLKVNDSTVPAGRVTYNVLNGGHEEHEMVLLRTDLDPATLPTQGGKVTEEGEGIEHVDEIDGVPPGEVKSLTVDLKPGKYLLICNIPGHAQQGMIASFTVG